MSPSAEDALIARHFKALATHPGALELADDAAVFVPPPGSDVVLTTDAVVAGVHFFPDDPPELVARKALRVNLSDLAGKGAAPAGFLLSLALSAEITDAWLAAFSRGLAEDAAAYGCPLLGGDTDRTPGPVAATIAAFGLLPSGTMVKRSGARPGDRLVVTGTIGDAALGLLQRREPATAARWRLEAARRDHLAARYLSPQPRVALAEAVRTCASGAMDVSDGLAGDAAKLCRASGVRAEIEIGRVPLSEAARDVLAVDPSRIETVLCGGDDFEVLAAVPPGQLDMLRRAGEAARIPVTEIGRVLGPGKGVTFRDADGSSRTFDRPSYSHF